MKSVSIDCSIHNMEWLIPPFIIKVNYDIDPPFYHAEQEQKREKSVEKLSYKR